MVEYKLKSFIIVSLIMLESFLSSSVNALPVLSVTNKPAHSNKVVVGYSNFVSIHLCLFESKLNCVIFKTNKDCVYAKRIRRLCKSRIYRRTNI
jgi:hypothetical protein